MSRIPVQFTYMTGIAEDLFPAARLTGSWDANGRRTVDWSSVDMAPTPGQDGCRAFDATVQLEAEDGEFEWGVELLTSRGEWRWGIATEVRRADSDRRVRIVRPSPQAAPGEIQQEIYYFNHSRHVGAQKYFRHPNDPTEPAAIRFSCWAPNARAVEVHLANLWQAGQDPATASLIDPDAPTANGRALRSFDRHAICGGYIADSGEGEHRSWGPFAMTRQPDGMWATDPADARLARFALFDHAPYMFWVQKDDGSWAYRTDIYSRCQIGYGARRPADAFNGVTEDLDGTVSCSVVVDPDLVTTVFSEPVFPETQWTRQDRFFANVPAPRARLQDLVIYELHLGALGAGKRPPDKPGTIEDAIALLDHLEDLGVNAIELLPLSEFGGGGAGWGYATSHYFAIEYSGGGRDQYKHFIRECHRRGITVILDVVYNHYNHNAERAEWMYDSSAHERNVYYWYEGQPSDYGEFNRNVESARRGHGGYVDNVSTAWAPRYWEEPVRAMFVSSALALATEFQVDAFRVDQTTSIHSYNALHADGRRLNNVNAFGGKLLRELTRSLKLAKPEILLIAEDHSNWDGVTRDPDEGGLGFDAAWYADFYHHLIGDTDKGSDYAKLIKTAGFGGDGPLAMDFFAGALQATSPNKVVYNESHDEAGNGTGTHRTMHVAVNGAPLIDATRRFAEVRCRFAAGMTILSAGVPMFLFGEEVGSEKDFLYGRVLENREDLIGLRYGSGQNLFLFYRELIRFRRAHAGIRSGNIDVFFVHNEHRLIAFRRWSGGDEEFLVVGSLNNRPFDQPSYTFNASRVPGGRWREVFNSDASMFDGDNVGSRSAVIETVPAQLDCVVPANGFVVFQRVF